MEPRRPIISPLPVAALFALGLSACASAPEPPSELVQARSAFKAAQDSAAWRYDRAGLNNAAKALTNAEKSFEEEGDSQATRQSAQVALQRARQAEIDGETTARQQAERRGLTQPSEDTQTAAEAQSQGPAQTATDETSAASEASAEAQPPAPMTGVEQTESETIDEPRQRGVVTLAVALFPTGKATLPTEDQERLDQLAQSVSARDGASIHIRGHADGTGSEDENLELSRERAEQVASYLSSRGIPRERMEVEAVGDSQPLADDNKAAGRALNRRVQLVVYIPAQQATAGGSL